MRFYPGLTPETYYRLTLAERNALVDYLNQEAEAARGR